MPTPISLQSNNRAGLCPHGLPPSACPICSGGGMAGGGRVKEAVASKPINSGEWSFMKCYAAGLAMRAQEARVENAKTAFERQIEFAQQLGKNIQNIADKIQNAIQNLQNSSPVIIQNILQVINNSIINPILNLMSQIPKLIENLAEFQKKLGEMLQQAGEKLTALLGDIKNFIDRKVIENIKKQIKKFFLWFTTDLEDENYKNDDALEVFKAREMKKYLVNIVTKIKKRNNNDNRTNKE